MQEERGKLVGRKNLYEGLFLFSITLNEEKRKSVCRELLQEITKRKGEVHKLHNWGRNQLAYPIKERKEGYYYIVYFSLAPSLIKELSDRYTINEHLLRFFFLRAKQVKEELTFKPLKQLN